MTPVISCASEFWREAMAATIRESGHPARTHEEAAAILRAQGYSEAQIGEYLATDLESRAAGLREAAVAAFHSPPCTDTSRALRLFRMLDNNAAVHESRAKRLRGV